jgi:hypothetical protein
MKQMKNIYDNKEQLFEVYLKNFKEKGEQIKLCEQIVLKKEYNEMMMLDYKYMPWWFIEEVLSIGYEFETEV